MKCYDPRDPEQHANNRETWKETENPALVMAHLSSGIVNWVAVRDLADYAEELVSTNATEGTCGSKPS